MLGDNFDEKIMYLIVSQVYHDELTHVDACDVLIDGEIITLYIENIINLDPMVSDA